MSDLVGNLEDRFSQNEAKKSLYHLYEFTVFQDWSMQTSKGSFFYEDDEIVTHIYNLNLREESAVYFTAYPVQEPASCEYN